MTSILHPKGFILRKKDVHVFHKYDIFPGNNRSRLSSSIFIFMHYYAYGTMIRLPTPFTLCSVTLLIRAVMTGLFHVATSERLSPVMPNISAEIILSLLFVVLAAAT